MMRRVWSRTGPWSLPILVLVEGALVWTDVLSVGTAVVVEVVLAATAIGRVLAGWRTFHRGRAARRPFWSTVEDAVAELVPRPVARFVVLEPQLWACLAQRPLRRRATCDRYAYGRNLRHLLWGAVGLVVVEGAVLDMVIAALWPGSVWLWLSLGLHAYSVLILLALIASCTVRSHRLTAGSLILHDSVFSRIEVPREAIRSAERIHDGALARTGWTRDEQAGAATLGFGDLSVRLEMDPTAAVLVDGAAQHGLRHLSFSVDDADRMVGDLAAIRVSAEPAP